MADRKPARNRAGGPARASHVPHRLGPTGTGRSEKTSAEESAGKMTLWTSAGLMLSYWCSASCRFCYVCCHPGHSVWAEPAAVVAVWQSLERLARRSGESARIHLTGGDPFGRPEILFEVLQRARDAGLPAVEKVETNAFWATDDDATRAMVVRLKDAGVPLVVTDCDVYHQEFVPFANVRRLVQACREILGAGGVRVRWWDVYNQWLDEAPDIAAMSDEERDALHTEALANARDRLNGRAAMLAGRLHEGQPPEGYVDQPCTSCLFASKHIHVDPHGYVVPGTCAGLIFGNVKIESIEEIYDWLNDHGASGPIFEALLTGGPASLVDFSKRYGFEPLPGGYITKCELCYHIRHTLFRANQCRKWLGPAECYPAWE